MWARFNKEIARNREKNKNFDKLKELINIQNNKLSIANAKLSQKTKNSLVSP